ncbi:LMWPc-domain-containing protein [Daldinia grandis]|nr:LMWPc-domain-containing protein [Daldinia grandis]
MTFDAPMDQSKISILFVCLGNICRSTMAEGVFRSIVNRSSSPYSDLIGRVDSCGIGGYHIGDEPDSRTMSTLKSHGITEYTHAARKLRGKDFEKFDYIFAMDESNLQDLKTCKGTIKNLPSSKGQVMLFGEFSGTGSKEVVRDPYYGGQDGFEKVYEQCKRFSTNFLEHTFPDAGKTTAHT